MGEDTRRIGEPGAVKASRKKGVFLRFGCAIGILLLLVPFTVNLMLTWFARDALKKEMERARKEGMPGSLLEIAPAPVAPEENAAPLYSASFGLMANGTPKEETAIEAFRAWVVDRAKEQKELPDARAYVEKNRAALDRLHQGVKLPHCRFDIQYDVDFWAMLLPHLASMRRASKLLQTEARVLLAEGRTSEALGVIDDMYRFGDALRGEPILISYLVRIAMRQVAAGTLRRALQQPLDDPKALAALAETLERTAGTEQLALALQGERVGGINGFERVRRGDLKMSSLMSTGSTAADRLYSFFGWMGCKDEAFYLRTMGDYVRLSQLPFGAAKGEEARVDRAVASASEMYLMSRMILPALGACRGAAEKDAARHCGARLAVALARYKLAHGGYPETLDELVPEFLRELPKDPFTGAPYRYSRSGDSARVYSLGRLGLDSGGGAVGGDDEGNILMPLGDQGPAGK